MRLTTYEINGYTTTSYTEAKARSEAEKTPFKVVMKELPEDYDRPDEEKAQIAKEIAERRDRRLKAIARRLQAV